jgi:hypothetical protein
VIIFVAIVVFALLPIFTTMLAMIDSRMLVARAEFLIDEVLPQTYLYLDQTSLGSGQLNLATSVVESFVRQRVALGLPDTLANRLEIIDVSIDKIPVSYASGHWLGEHQPAEIPAVTCLAIVRDYSGKAIYLRRTVELTMEGP